PRGSRRPAICAQVAATATNTQYRADITLPAGKAVDYHMDITFEEADQFSLVDLQSQLAASGWPYHVQSVVTAPPKAATNLTFHREVWGGKSMIIVTWAPPAAGQPVPTGSTVTGTRCGTLQSSSYADAAFTAPSPAKTTR